MPKARITWLWKSFLCRNGIVVFTYSHLNTRGGWENLRKLCKPETQSRVRITFKKFSNLLNVLTRKCKHRKKVLYCLSSNRLPTKLSRHICSVRRKTIYYITIPLRHRKLFHSQIILALGNFCGSTYQQVFWLYSNQQPFLWSVELYENPFPERSSNRHALKLVVCGNYSRILHRGCMTNSAICPHSIGRE